MDAVVVDRLVKSYRDVRAVDDVTFRVKKGEIFGMLGPNGAGKTTTIECMTGLKDFNAGTVSVLGLQPGRERKALYRRIGVQLQETAWQDKVRVEEICRLFASFYEKPASWDSLLKKFGLQDKRRAFVGGLSGGQKQKLSILLALLPEPEVVFLDELTTGLDPKARRAMWEHIKSLKEEGKTVFMTTHYMEEAEALCDRVCIVKDGRIVSLDAVPGVIRAAGLCDEISFESDQPLREALRRAFPEIGGVAADGARYTLHAPDEGFTGRLTAWLESAKIRYRNLNIKKPTLEEAYLKLTGTRMEEDE